MTFASLLTPAGIVAGAALIVSFVQIVKAALPVIGERVSGALIAFIATGVLYAIAGAVLPDRTADSLLQVFASWVATAGLAMGIKAGSDHVQTVIGGTS